MLRRFAFRSLAIGLVVWANCSISHGLVMFESSYSYDQQSFGGNFVGGEQQIPLDLVDRKATTPNSTFTFNTRVIPDDPFELRARAGLDVNIDGRGTEIGWSSVEASSTATTSLIDFGIVEGFGNAQSGVIHFTWILSGISEIKLTPAIPSDAYVVEQLFTIGILSTGLVGDVPETLLNEQSGQTTVDSLVPHSAGIQQFVVPWTANLEVPVVFELEVIAGLKVMNLDAAGFDAKLDADFTNTATLDSVEIFDSNGNLLTGASFIGRDNLVYVQPVPEPSSGTAWGLLSLCIGLNVYRRRHQQDLLGS